MENKDFNARKKIGEFKTFGEYLKDGMERTGVSISALEDRFAEKKNTHTEKEIKLWLRDAYYPDITTIYMISEILEIHPNDLLEAKQNMQEAGLNAIDMLTMRVVCNFIDISIWKLHIINNILFWIILCSSFIYVWFFKVPNAFLTLGK